MKVEGLVLSEISLNHQHTSSDTMRGLYKAGFTVTCHPQAALHVHAVTVHSLYEAG